MLPPSLPQENLNSFAREKFGSRKGKIKKFQGLLNTASEPKLIPWNLKPCFGLPVRVGAIDSEMINRDLI